MTTYAYTARRAVRDCLLAFLAGFACLASVSVQADSFRLIETRNDRLRCRFDPDLGEKACSVSTAGKYDLTLKLSAETLMANDIDLVTLLQDAKGEQILPVSLLIGAYQFDGDVFVESDYQFGETGVTAEWMSSGEKCVDSACDSQEPVRTGKLRLTATPDTGIAFRLKGVSLSDDNDEYGDSLFADVCTGSGTVSDQEVVSVMIGDGGFVEVPLTLNCRLRTITVRKGEAGEFDLVRERITAKLGQQQP